MLKRLSSERWEEIKAQHKANNQGQGHGHGDAGEKCCFMPVTTTGGWIGLAEAIAGENGYHELPLDEVYADSYAEMSAYADELNAAMGCSPLDAVLIVASTPHAASAE